MGLGLGIVLVVTGSVLMWALNVDIKYVDDDTLGLILFVVGVLAILLSLLLTFQQGRTKHVEERRYDQ